MSEQSRNNGTSVEKALDQVRQQASAQAVNLYEIARRVLLAGIGALALTAEEARIFLNRLVERGELAESEAHRLLQEYRRVLEERRVQATESVKEVAEETSTRVARQAEEIEQRLEARIQAVLERMNVPTRAEIDALSRKIEALNDKIERLRRLREETGTE